MHWVSIGATRAEYVIFVYSNGIPRTNHVIAEVVLCVLLESFKFELDADVEWHMSFLMVPYVVGNASEPQLPLKVQYIGD